MQLCKPKTAVSKNVFTAFHGVIRILERSVAGKRIVAWPFSIVPSTDSITGRRNDVAVRLARRLHTTFAAVNIIVIL